MMWSHLIFSLLLCLSPSLAFKIDDSCKGDDNKLDHIITAAKEATNMAQNAIARADFDKNPGTMMRDLFGDDSPGTFQAVKKCYQDAVDKTGTYSESDDENLIIYCGSAHLNTIDAKTGYFRDPIHNNINVKGIMPAAGSQDACSGNTEAFGYPTGGTKPGFVIVICQLAFDKSDMDHEKNSPKLVNQWRQSGGLDGLNPDRMLPGEVTVDIIKKYLSIKVLHEFMHCGDCINLPAQLPDSQKPEQYGYAKIMAKDGNNYVLSAKDKQRNADSYTLAAGVWYLPLYYSQSGRWVITKKADKFTPIDLPPSS